MSLVETLVIVVASSARPCVVSLVETLVIVVATQTRPCVASLVETPVSDTREA